MPLQILNFPIVSNPFPGSAILSITNDNTETGLRSCTWSLKDQGGYVIGWRQYTNNLTVITNTPFVGPIQIMQALIAQGGVLSQTYAFPVKEYTPSIGGNPIGTIPTEEDPGSFVQSVTMTQSAEDAMQWKVTINYAPFDVPHEMGTSQVQNGSFEPTEEKPTVEWSSVKYNTYYPQDINGNPFVNTVGDPLENPPAREESRQSLLFERNEPTYQDSYAQTFRDSVNSDQFLGFDVGQAKCRDITGKRIYSADYGYYWKVRYEFEFRIATFTNSDGTTTTYGWEEVILNAGYRQLDPTTGNPVQIIISGSPISQPVALTKAGKYDPTADPYYLTFQNYPSQTFGNLNIPPEILTENQ